MNAVQILLPPEPAPEERMEVLFNPHTETLTMVAPVDHLASLQPIVDPALKGVLHEERRKRAFEGAVSLQTIVSQNESIEHANIDTKTGLRSVKAKEKELQHIFDRKEPGELTVLFVDLNGLKRVNDLTPDKHDSGDAYLRKAADALMSGLRPTDLGYRNGGDELLAVLDGSIDDETKDAVIARLKEHVKEVLATLELPLPEGKTLEDLYLGLSIGGAVKRPGETLEELILRADQECAEDKDEFYAEIEERTGKNMRR